MITKQLFDLLHENYDEMVAIRRHLHKNPELSFQEFETAKYITSFYNSLNIEVTSNVGGNGVVAKVYGAKQGKTVALRADFDALPIQDEKNVPYKSQVNGVMHACGHDGHTATLLILAKCLHKLKANLEGTYVFIHQHAEEIAPGGALSMIEDGCLQNVDIIFGTHLWATKKLGTIALRTGPIMAAADRFEIMIQGQGGHGAQPHLANDAIVTAAQLITNLQQIVSRRINPTETAVLSIGSIVADNSFNVIADKVNLTGTVRTFNKATQSLIKNELEKVINGTCIANNCTYSFNYQVGFPPVINEKNSTNYLINIAETIADITTIKTIDRQMTGEDFAYYLQKVKGCFFFTGAMPDNEQAAFPHHHPKFDINEKAMLTAAKTLGLAAISYR